MLFLKESWQPEKIEPPDGIGEKLGDQEGPGLAKSDKGGPAYLCIALIVAASNIGQFLRRTTRMLLRISVNGHPESKPEQPRSPRDQERRSPAVVDDDPGHDQRRQNCANVTARIENSGCQRALFLRKPLGHGLDACRKCSRFAESQGGPRERETQDGRASSVSHGCNTPENDRHGISNASSHQ